VKQTVGDRATSFTFSLACGGLRPGSLSDPEQLVILFDGTEIAGLHPAAAFRHNGGLNAALADDHVEWVSEQTFPAILLAPGGKP
jgi:hypothetical protein